MRITYVGDRGHTVVAGSSPPFEAICTSNVEKIPLKMDDLPCGRGVCPVALHRPHRRSVLLYDPASLGMRITYVGDRGHTVVARPSLPFEAICTSNVEMDPLKMDDLPCGDGECPVAPHRPHTVLIHASELASVDLCLTKKTTEEFGNGFVH